MIELPPSQEKLVPKASPFLNFIMSLASGEDPSAMDQMTRYLDLSSNISSQRPKPSGKPATEDNGSPDGIVHGVEEMTIDPHKLAPEKPKSRREPISPIRRFHEQNASSPSTPTSPTPAKSLLRSPLRSPSSTKSPFRSPSSPNSPLRSPSSPRSPSSSPSSLSPRNEEPPNAHKCLASMTHHLDLFQSEFRCKELHLHFNYVTFWMTCYKAGNMAIEAWMKWGMTSGGRISPILWSSRKEETRSVEFCWRRLRGV
jgi:hypothetical protein